MRKASAFTAAPLCPNSADSETRLPLRLGPGNVDVLHVGTARAPPAPVDQRLDLGVVALEDGLDGAVRKVAHPAADAQRPRSVARPAEAIRRVRWELLDKGNVLGLAYTPFCLADLRLVDPGD